MAAEIEAKLSLEISKFQRAITSVRRMTRSLASSAGGFGKKIAGGLFTGAIKAVQSFAKIALAAFAAIGVAAAGMTVAITVGLKSAFDLGSRLSDVAAQIGDSAGKAQLLETMFVQAGVAAEKMAPTLNKMQKSIIEAGDGLMTYKRAFDALNLSVEDLKKLGSVEQFKMISEAITGLEDPADRAARAMQIFGRSGGQLMALFDNPEAIALAESMLGSQAEIMDRKAGEFDRAADILAGLRSKLTALFVGMGDSLVGNLLPALESLNKIDLAPIGQRLGESLSKALTTVKAAFAELGTGGVFALLGEMMKLGFLEAVNGLVAGLQAGITGSLQMFIEGFQILMTKSFWKGLFHVLETAAGGFLILILKAVETFSGALSKVGGKLNPFRDQFGNLASKAKADREKVEGKISTAAQNAGKEFTSREIMAQLKASAKNVAAATSASYKGAAKIFDTETQRASIADKLARINRLATRGNVTPGATPEVAGSPGANATASVAAGGLFAEIDALMGRSPQEALLKESQTQTKVQEETRDAMVALLDRTPKTGGRKPLPEVAVYG